MPWVAKLDDEGPRNGDVIVRTAKGTLVAVVYAAQDQTETFRRAAAVLAADPDRDVPVGSRVGNLRFAEQSLRDIANLRPLGDVDTCKNPRKLVEQMERIAIDALSALGAPMVSALEEQSA